MGNRFNKQLLEAAEKQKMLTRFKNDHSLPEINRGELGRLPRPVEQFLVKDKKYEDKLSGESLNENKFLVLNQGQYYKGDVNQQDKPHGFGRIIYSDGSVLLAKFVDGQVQKQGTFVFSDGSSYQGAIRNNKANGKGILKINQLLYQGQFKDNNFEGQGHLKYEDWYQFHGTYRDNKKAQGYLVWYEQKQGQKFKNSYSGQFDENQLFQGKGKLRNKYGLYKGMFKKGRKQGRGTFEYEIGLTYQGDYQNGVRQGQGTIYNIHMNSDKQITHSQAKQLIAYQGNFFQGMPHGQGSVYSKDTNKLIRCQWNMGVDLRQFLKQ